MPAAKHLIVNADDFGMSAGVNQGIVEAHEHGIVTSASLMVRWPAAVEAGAYGRRNPAFSLGLHVDLCEWTFRDGDWAPLYERVFLSDADAVAREVSSQLTAFHDLVGRDPTHFDSHQHVHCREPVRSIVVECARALGVPVRRSDSDIRYCDYFYGQTMEGAPYPDAIGVEALLGVLAALPEGITELGCHPGRADEDLETMYRIERDRELETLCDPRVKRAIAERNIQLCSFTEARDFSGAG